MYMYKKKTPRKENLILFRASCGEGRVRIHSSINVRHLPVVASEIAKTVVQCFVCLSRLVQIFTEYPYDSEQLNWANNEQTVVTTWFVLLGRLPFLPASVLYLKRYLVYGTELVDRFWSPLFGELHVIPRLPDRTLFNIIRMQFDVLICCLSWTHVLTFQETCISKITIFEIEENREILLLVTEIQKNGTPNK